MSQDCFIDFIGLPYLGMAKSFDQETIAIEKIIYYTYSSQKEETRHAMDGYLGKMDAKEVKSNRAQVLLCGFLEKVWMRPGKQARQG